MNILAIETATERLSAALVTGDAVFERNADSRSSHCELLAGFIGDILKDAGVDFTDIHCVAVSLGPGSFTGLRIGIATAMGLAYSLGVPAVGVDTLMAMAWKAAEPGTLVCPLIDARRSEAYTGIYRLRDRGGLPEVIKEPSAVPVSDLAGTLGSYDEPIVVTGPAGEKFRNALERYHVPRVNFITGEPAKPTARAIGEIGALLLEKDGGINPAALEPVYIRRSDAETARDGRNAARRA